MGPKGPPTVDLATAPHDSLKANIIACSVLCFLIAAVFVALRFYTRTSVVKVLGATDWLLLVCLVGSALQSAFFINQAVHGLGAHWYDINFPVHFTPLQQSAWFTLLWYNLSLLFVKASFLLLYRKIFPNRKAQLACKVILALVIFSALWTTILTATACIPLRAYWTFPPPEGAYCHRPSLWWVNTALHVATDFMIWVLPVPIIWGVKTGGRDRIILAVLFSLGFVVAFISIIRVIYLDIMHREMDMDFAYIGARFCFLSVVELNAGIVVACLITLKPLVHKFFPRLLQFEAPAANGDAPPTIGTRAAHREIRGSATGRAELEAWKMESIEAAETESRCTGSQSSASAFR